MSDTARRRFDILITAAEAFPAFEREFLRAQKEIIASFRVFDPWTTLRSPEARKIGPTWFDLITDTLNRKVSVSIVITDFDPVACHDLHAGTWSSLRALRAAAEASRHPELLTVSAAMHPARVGLLPRTVLWRRSIKELSQNLEAYNALPKAEAQDRLREVPGLRALVEWKGDKLVPKRGKPPPLVPVSHHQKLAVFDNETLYIGGLDLDDRRYDTPEHRQSAEQTWHDVQVIVDGPIVAEAAAHIRNFRAIAAGQAPGHCAHLLRTMSARRSFPLPRLSPKAVLSEMADAHSAQIAKAKRLIYLETQFFRYRKLARQLAKRAQENPDLQMILILPAAPEEAAFNNSTGTDVAYGEHLQTECIKIVRKAFGDRLFIGCPAQPRTGSADKRAAHYGAPIVYVHAKVSIFDDAHGIISSANLNGRSFGWDTEAGIPTGNTEEVKALKKRCFDHWLGADADPACYDDATAREAWAGRAARNAQLPPDQRQGFLLPYSVAPAEEVGYNVPAVPEEMV
ncbi:phospholipase D-like domain-containing protein [Loktanella agnita]|uniref:phospholipase D-like domain-containing protein n=1 Tax=Loktanella agnita TaxID=287097 RepID=UPI0039893A2F